MYQVFNMGCRMEIYTVEKIADQMISMAKDFGIDARVIGRVEAADQTSLLIHSAKEEMAYFPQ
jgi:phosphoribosylformylglycinamidine cyclo-ligase